MSEHARRNLVCSSWHKCPEGWQSWSGLSGGYTFRPFCGGKAGHAGDHEAWIESIEQFPQKTMVHNMVPGDPRYDTKYEEVMTFPKSDVMTWSNTLGIPAWLERTTIHGIAMMREHGWTEEDILGQ